jgi:hypothetical protein
LRPLLDFRLAKMVPDLLRSPTFGEKAQMAGCQEFDKRCHRESSHSIENRFPSDCAQVGRMVPNAPLDLACATLRVLAGCKTPGELGSFRTPGRSRRAGCPTV